MNTPPTTILQIQGPVVVLPLDEYLEQKAQLEEYRRLKTVYDRERQDRFRRLLAIPPEQVEADVNAALKAVREQS